MVVNATANGTLLDKSCNEAYDILEKIANNYYQYPTTGAGIGKKAVGTIELDGQTSSSTSIEALLKEYTAKNDVDVQFKRFLDVLKQLHINTPLVNALEKMPSYVKFMKDILSKKCRLGEFEIVALIKRCTTMLINKLPLKLKDRKSFTIPCSIGNHYVGKALCDLGASINLMFMSILRKLGIGKARPTTIMLQPADRSYSHLKECEADQDVPIILGRLFLLLITSNIFNALKYATENEECHAIRFTETTLEEQFAKFFHNNSDSDEDLFQWSDTAIFEDIGELMKANQFVDRPEKKFESLNLSDCSFNPPKPSIEEPLTLELKPLS
ncbi:uncharacterized protein LOC108481872 [Gossypium arboreum]|uniref:uncharacterized protein LOC108481872 n=1 Tax=Gossypium arboreum TaxID=29729 RepID=UPI000819111E|nr:uncharacterized protein LOC108481872 [Gossypium arboreum]